ncbi:MAG TPA: AzlC family ABC transporter permease, partial [Burkholderiales bacterium]|nr:AzlC family ABC transporter permease [Burkholderiales bacterium]
WTRAGLVTGARLAVPAMPVMALFSMAFGAYAAQKGLALSVATLMSTLMFAGASQFVATEMWSHPMPAAAILALCVVTGIINMRFLLITASLRPWLGSLPARQTYPAMAVMTEPGWLIALRYRAEGGADAGTVAGSGFALWIVWIAGTMAGHIIGSLVAEPRRYGLDIIMPVFFTVILVPLWRGARRAAPWVVAGLSALLAARYLPGSWYLIIGAIAGAATGAFQDD